MKWTVNALSSKCPVSAEVAKNVPDVTIEVEAAPVLAPDLARAHAQEAEAAEAETEVETAAETVATEAIVASTVVIWVTGPGIAPSPVLGKSLSIGICLETSYIFI